MERHLIEPESPDTVDVKCTICKGSGKQIDWEYNDENELVPHVEACDECRGIGMIAMDAEEYSEMMKDHYADLDGD